MRDDFQIWIDAVCGCVRFWPDRRSIAKELRIHYEDHCRDLERLHYSPEISRQRALEAMGSAQEVGYALDRVHRPWLGWLWEVSRFLFLALAVILAYNTWDGYTGGIDPLISRTCDQLAWVDPPSGACHTATDYLDIWLAAGAVTEEDGHIRADISLWVEAQDVFHSDLQGLWQYLEITVDGQGVPWGSQLGIPTGLRIEDREVPTSGYWQYIAPAVDGWTRYQANIALILDSAPRQVEIVHPWNGWRMAVEWGTEL